jgi:hypothetical protein
MAGISTDDVIRQIIAVLSEAFEGPAQQWSYFTDHGRESGMLGTLDAVDAEEASRPVAGTSIAAHAHHVAFGLAASAAWIRGDRGSRDWQESWKVSKVDEESWRNLRRTLEERLQDLRAAIASGGAASAEAAGVSIAAAAHAAYHLGAIRQKVAALRRP